MRKEFDGLAYHTDVKERNRILNRLKYYRKKAANIKVEPLEEVEYFEAF